MTFGSDLARMNFHLLPTEVQAQYQEMEKELARKGQTLGILAVMHYEDQLEITLSIFGEFDCYLTTLESGVPHKPIG